MTTTEEIGFQYAVGTIEVSGAGARVGVIVDRRVIDQHVAASEVLGNIRRGRLDTRGAVDIQLHRVQLLSGR